MLENMRNTQQALSEAQREMATSRHADVNLTLGAATARNLDWRIMLGHFEMADASLGLADARAKSVQASLESIKSMASDLMPAIVGARNARDGQALLRDTAKAAMETMRERMNASFNGEFLFAGQNVTQAPFAAFAGSSAEAAFDAAFLAEFGIAKDDPAAAAITPSAMQQFLDIRFEALFEPAAWSGNWSSASGSNPLTRLSKTQTADLGANANEQPIRDIFNALTILAEAGNGRLNQAAFETVADHALARIASAVQGLGAMQARIGVGQADVSRVKQSNTMQKNVLTEQISKTESIDVHEVALRVNSLSAQLETSYAIAGKLSKLSLVNYI